MPPKKTAKSKEEKPAAEATPTHEQASRFETADVEKNRIIAALSYIFILCLVPLILKQNSPYAQFHARQGLTITVGWFVFFIIGIVPILGWLIAFVGNITLLVVSILGVIKTLDGKAWEIPFIYEWSKKWNL